MSVFLIALIAVFATSLFFRNKELPMLVGVPASFVLFYGADIVWSISGVIAAALILDKFVSDDYFL